MGITFPIVDGVALRGQLQRSHGLAEGAVRHARLRAQLDHHARARQLGKQKRQRNVLDPRRGRAEQQRRRKDDGMIKRVKMHQEPEKPRESPAD